MSKKTAFEAHGGEFSEAALCECRICRDYLLDEKWDAPKLQYYKNILLDFKYNDDQRDWLETILVKFARRVKKVQGVVVRPPYLTNTQKWRATVFRNGVNEKWWFDGQYWRKA